MFLQGIALLFFKRCPICTLVNKLQGRRLHIYWGARWNTCVGVHIAKLLHPGPSYKTRQPVYGRFLFAFLLPNICRDSLAAVSVNISSRYRCVKRFFPLEGAHSFKVLELANWVVKLTQL